MQNSVVAKPPEPPKPIVRKPAVVQDFFLEPLPVPDATESESDTVWGLWEHSLKSPGDAQAPQATDFQDFPDTEVGLPPVDAQPQGEPVGGKKSEPKT
jgi:hypothetical protein